MHFRLTGLLWGSMGRTSVTFESFLFLFLTVKNLKGSSFSSFGVFSVFTRVMKQKQKRKPFNTERLESGK